MRLANLLMTTSTRIEFLKDHVLYVPSTCEIPREKVASHNRNNRANPRASPYQPSQGLLKTHDIASNDKTVVCKDKTIRQKDSFNSSNLGVASFKRPQVSSQR